MWSDENYYLVAYDEDADKIKHFRVDKMKDIELTEFEQALYDYNIEGESFICGHDEIECKHEVRRIANELLSLARRQLEADIHREVRNEISENIPRWKYFGDGVAGGGERQRYLIRSARGYYYTSACVSGCYYLEMEDLEQLPGLPKED